MRKKQRQGFTLIELSIVLVIIGLIVGGILVGRDLIEAAAIRAQISQIEKFNTAVNTFRVKYGYLPGDLPASTASQVGFASRGGGVGEGDGNGILEASGFGWTLGFWYATGETELFWNDLGMAQLIPGSFTADDGTGATSIEQGGTLPVSAFLPTAKIGSANYVFVWSGGYGTDEGDSGAGASTNYLPLVGSGETESNGINYFGLSAVPGGLAYSGFGAPGITPSQAQAIDQKMDDGLPQSGHVIAMYPSENADVSVLWASGVLDGNGFYVSGDDDPSGTGGPVVAGDGVATPGTNLTCYDNKNVPGATENYSMDVANGANINCALSFQFQ